jgi:hypothetical protein
MKVVIDNFQSIAHAELEINGLTVLVGPSDRGKSAAARAVEAAFFNLAGEYFVRTGTERAAVQVLFSASGRPEDSSVHAVVWRKGGGKNEFEVDGALHAKVGTKAPDALKALGFRDELIGARMKDDGTIEGGKWVRPQFAGQFDEIYLLTEQGTFISEVIVKLSRLGVLQRAERQCALDLRSAKSLLKTRQGDLEVATAAAEKLAQAPLLRSRLDALVEQWDALDDQKAKVTTVRTLLAKRREAISRQQLASHMPPPAPQRLQEILDLQEDYRQLLAARQGVARRAALASLPKKLPKSRSASTPEHTALGAMVARWKQLNQLVGAQVMRQTATDAALARAAEAMRKQGETRQALDQYRKSIDVCPLCEQPMRVEEAVAV